MKTKYSSLKFDREEEKRTTLQVLANGGSIRPDNHREVESML